ncbi:MAG TPA: response regulator [Terriglobales bacterium]|nr:response regulator [Terriglobales bacterium]
MRIKVLLVDDEPNILMTLEMVLEGEGFDVHTASSGRAAKAALAHSTFDVILTDLSLESRDTGYDIVRAAKDHPAKPATLVMSGFPDLLCNWQSQGADAALQKPTEVPELLATINRLVVQR